MKRSRAPSSTRGATTRGHPAAQQSSAEGYGPYGGAAGVSGARRGHATKEEESQQSLEVDVGMEDISFTDPAPDIEARRGAAPKAVAGTKRCMTRGPQRSRGEAPASTVSEGAPEAAATGVKASLGGATTAGSNTTGPQNSAASKSATRGGKAHKGGGRASGGGNRGEAAASKEESTSSSATPTRATTTSGDGGDASKDGGFNGGQGGKQEASSAEGKGGDDGKPGDAPSRPKKKKYIRNPETHKAYRTRMEGELAQARKLLEDANRAMVELARDYKRQQAVIERYRMEDNSLLSTSQLTQSQLSQSQPSLPNPQHNSPLQPYSNQPQSPPLPAAQTQARAQAWYSPPLLALHSQHLVSSPSPGPSVQRGSDAPAAGGSAGVAVASGAIARTSTLEATLLGGSQESMDKEMPESVMGELGQDDGVVGLSQTSAISLTILETEEPLSQVTQWIAAFQESQEEWNLDEMMMSQERGHGGQDPVGGVVGAGDNGAADGQSEEELPDSVEAVALAAEALSPSRGGLSPAPLSSDLPNCSLAVAQAATVATSGVPATGPSGRELSSLRGDHVGGMPCQALALQQALAFGVGSGGVVRVGVACLVTNFEKPGSVLVGRRKGSLGAGTLGLPGGHLEIGEEWSACAAREVLEETGLEVGTPTFAWVINSPNMEGGKHYVTIFMLAVVSDEKREPKVMEPDKCEGWLWVPWKSLGVQRSSRSRGSNDLAARSPLFQPLAELRKTTYSPFRSAL